MNMVLGQRGCRLKKMRNRIQRFEVADTPFLLADYNFELLDFYQFIQAIS
jgi:hypothetical protein